MPSQARLGIQENHESSLLIFTVRSTGAIIPFFCKVSTRLVITATTGSVTNDTLPG